jgi:hypothetical protein
MAMKDDRQPWLANPEDYCWCDTCIRQREEGMKLSEKYPDLYEEFMIHMAEIGADREPDTDWEEAEHSWWIAYGLAE